MVTTPEQANQRVEPANSKSAGGDHQVGKVEPALKTATLEASKAGIQEVHDSLQKQGSNFSTAVGDRSVASNNQNAAMTGQDAIQNATYKDGENPADPRTLKTPEQKAAFIASHPNDSEAIEQAKQAGLINKDDARILQEMRDKGNGQIDANQMLFDKNGHLVDPTLDCNQKTGVAAFDGNQDQGAGDQANLGKAASVDQTRLNRSAADLNATEKSRSLASRGADGQTEKSETASLNPHDPGAEAETGNKNKLAQTQDELYTANPGKRGVDNNVQAAALRREGNPEDNMDTASSGGAKKRNDGTVKVGADTTGTTKQEVKETTAANQDAPKTSAEALKHMQDAGWIKQGTDGTWQVGDKFSSPAAREQFAKQFNEFMNRKDVTDQQKASVIDSTQKLLEDHNNKGGVSDNRRQELATSMMENLAQGKADQGNSNRCNVTELGNATYSVAPEVAAARTTNIIHNGAWDIPANQSSTGQAQHIDMSDAIARLNKGGNLLDNKSGEVNLHSELDQIALAKQFNQQRGMVYTVGDPSGKNDTGERLTYKDGSPVLDGNGKAINSPNMTMADIADAAKSKELGIADKVTVVADKTWQNGRNTPNLTVVDKNDPSKLQGVMDGIKANGQNHYIILGVAGNDRSIVDASGRADAGSAGPHAGHAIGMRYDPTAMARDGKTQGAFIGKNSWGERNDKIWDQNVVNDNGTVNVANLTRATDMSLDRTKTDQLRRAPQNTEPKPYHEWHDSHPAVDERRGGTIQRSTVEQDDQTKRAKEIEEQQKKKEEELKSHPKDNEPDKPRKAENEEDPAKRDSRYAAQDKVGVLEAQASRLQAELDLGLARTNDLYPQLTNVIASLDQARRDAA